MNLNTSQLSVKSEKGRFEALFENASMGILVANAEGIIIMANNYLLGQFGYSNDEIVGKAVELLIPSRYNHKHHTHRENYARHPENRPMGVGRDLFATKKNGAEFPVEVSLSHFETSEGKFVIAFVIDITKRKESENAMILQKELLAQNNLKIEELNNELEKKVEMRTSQLQEAMQQIEASRDDLTKALSKEKELSDLKSRFVSMASHEFRTPLSTILSSVSLLAKYTETQEQENRNRHIVRIKSSVNNLVNILDDFLSLGKIEDGKIVAKPEIFDVKLFLQNLVTEAQNLVKPQQQIIYHHEGDSVFELDKSFLRNILLNLISNAIKFSADDGIININASITKARCTLNISDHGIGISEDDQKHLFERFFRATNATNIQGTGLGLHIVAKYAELMNGKIKWQSELENGTTFTISFKK
ncbi:MAG: PAS domain-containing sensor histidine kinase [Ferruginibacter sp.]